MQLLFVFLATVIIGLVGAQQGTWVNGVCECPTTTTRRPNFNTTDPIDFRGFGRAQRIEARANCECLPTNAPTTTTRRPNFNTTDPIE
ncbi:unnamed protein product [Caenorhabditis brenneri]